MSLAPLGRGREEPSATEGEGSWAGFSSLTPLTLPTASAAGPFPLPGGARDFGYRYAVTLPFWSSV